MNEQAFKELEILKKDNNDLNLELKRRMDKIENLS